MIAQLKNIGLSNNEAKVYLAMLELGPSSILEIAAKAGINRPTTYVQVESLKKMGLVSTQMKGKKQLFIAEDPSQLEFIVHEQEKLLEQRKEELGKVMPGLKEIFELAEDKPHVRFFEGIEGLQRMQDAFLSTKDKTILAIASLDDVFRVFPQHPKAYAPRRVKKGIHSRLIYTTSQGAFLKKDDTEMLREAKYIVPEKFTFSVDMTIYDDKVAIAALKGKLSGVIIQNSEIADSFRGIFELLWAVAD